MNIDNLPPLAAILNCSVEMERAVDETNKSRQPTSNESHHILLADERKRSIEIGEAQKNEQRGLDG